MIRRYGGRFSGQVISILPPDPSGEPGKPLVDDDSVLAIPPKLFPAVIPDSFKGDGEPAVLSVKVPSYKIDDQAQPTHKLLAIHAVAVAPGFALPENPDDLLNGNHPSGTVDTSDAFGGFVYEVEIASIRAVTGEHGGPVELQLINDYEE
jgi:hypothetical protein